MRAAIALGVGLALIATAIAATLSRAPNVLIGTNSIVDTTGGFTHGSGTVCQDHESLPQGTSAVRVLISADIGPRITFTAFSGSHLVTRGVRAAGWGFSETLTIPVKRVARSVEDAKLCFRFGAAVEPILVHSAQSRGAASDGPGAQGESMRIEYLRADRRSWWSLAPAVIRRMGLGRAPSGSWVAPLAILLMVAVTLLVARLLWRMGSSIDARRIPRAAWGCALIACLSAVTWSLITPPFQVPDEPAHFAYAQYLAETGRLPNSAGDRYSAEENVALRDLHQREIRINPEKRTISSQPEQSQLQADLARPLSRRGSGDAEVAAAEPPLYYALETIPYRLGSSGSLLDRLELMRLLGSLLAGLTALLAYLFVAEVLPRVRWAWTVGGLGVALTPLLGFMSGGVNPDGLLCAACAAGFYCLARGFRRGLTPTLAILIGAVIAVGLLTKLNFIGIAPGMLVGLLVLGGRRSKLPRPLAYRYVATGAAIALSPAGLYILVNLLSNHPGLGLVSTALHRGAHVGSLLRESSYIWQLYLPRIPGMTDYFPGISTIRGIWFARSVGLYGWLDTSFPAWVATFALLPVALIAGLVLRALVGTRVVIRGHLAEIGVYALIALGVILLIGLDSFLSLSAKAGEYTEPRYLLPLLPLVGGTLALGARGAGRRWGPVVGTLIVLLLLAHELFSQLLVVSRYYG